MCRPEFHHGRALVGSPSRLLDAHHDIAFALDLVLRIDDAVKTSKCELLEVFLNRSKRKPGHDMNDVRGKTEPDAPCSRSNDSDRMSRIASILDSLS
jgi:hypothetical protein